VILAETTHVPAGAEERANRALAAALLEVGIQPSPRMPRRVAFYSAESIEELEYARQYGERDWSHADLSLDGGAPVAQGALWLPASEVDVHNVAGLVSAAIYRVRPVN
jgi:hypothetical protein